ncbi:unnamed protein product [Penicillium camemberti]|uniref:Str. FM013 n=1 Tax=Penicillium camemberti (strain FM 013) TaxID=1429867 RepID=A0A0G4PVL7_PENC3|nr:unnamed protein product [Penicillium camemberti]
MSVSPLQFPAAVAEVGVSESSSHLWASDRREGKTKVVVFLHITTCGLISDNSHIYSSSALAPLCMSILEVILVCSVL